MSASAAGSWRCWRAGTWRSMTHAVRPSPICRKACSRGLPPRSRAKISRRFRCWHCSSIHRAGLNLPPSQRSNARFCVAQGLMSKPWVKTSLAPGSKVVTDYFNAAGVTEPLNTLRFNTVGYGCTTCIGNSGPLPKPIGDAVESGKLVVASVLSGNRNFEGRINPMTRFNYLMSPPLVVAYAIAGRVDIDFDTEPLAIGTDGPVFLRDVWPAPKEVADEILRSVRPDMFRKQYANVFEGDETWRSLPIPKGDLYAWEEDSTYVK